MPNSWTAPLNVRPPRVYGPIEIKPMDTFSLHVPDPCNEAWNAMTPQHGGRFCDRCRHTVADLTGSTDAELVTLFSGGNAPHCARFDAAQLDRVLAPRRKRSGLLPLAAFTSLLAVACGTETITQGTPRQTVGEVAIRPVVAHVDTTASDSLRPTAAHPTGSIVVRPDTRAPAPRTPREGILLGKPLLTPHRTDKEEDPPNTK